MAKLTVGRIEFNPSTKAKTPAMPSSILELGGVLKPDETLGNLNSPSSIKTWAVIIIRKQNHALHEYKQFKTRKEARDHISIWKSARSDSPIEATFFIYLARTRGF